MASKKTKLELTWIGKENRPRLEPRILIPDDSKSHHAQHRMADGDLFDNRLIFGDNLLALKALEQDFAGKVKCVFIDPPYNTGSAFEHHDDGVEHSLWLSLMVDTLNIVAHDRFQEIVAEANQPGSAIRMQQIVLNPEGLKEKTITVVSQSQLATQLGLQPTQQPTATTQIAGTETKLLYTTPEEQKVAQITYQVIRKLESQPQTLPSVTYLQKPEVQARVLGKFRPISPRAAGNRSRHLAARLRRDRCPNIEAGLE